MEHAPQAFNGLLVVTIIACLRRCRSSYGDDLTQKNRRFPEFKRLNRKRQTIMALAPRSDSDHDHDGRR